MLIGLGTAQFGLDYGVTNPKGKLSSLEVNLLLELSSAAGVAYLDTSPPGKAEAVIGHTNAGRDFEIITKTKIEQTNIVDETSIQRIVTSFWNSLRVMGIDNCYGLLIHDTRLLKSPYFKELIYSLKALQGEGLVKKLVCLLIHRLMLKIVW